MGDLLATDHPFQHVNHKLAKIVSLEYLQIYILIVSNFAVSEVTNWLWFGKNLYW